ncbi:MAG: hypothetical protein ACSHYB_10005 [Roseibacillus sp.]
MKNIRYFLPVIALIGAAFLYKPSDDSKELKTKEDFQTDRAASDTSSPSLTPTTSPSQPEVSQNNRHLVTNSSPAYLNKTNKSQEEIEELSQSEQKSLWAAFSEARREIRPIPESWSQREENLGFDFYALHPKQNLTTRFGPQGIQFVSSDRTYTEEDAEKASTSWTAQMNVLSFAGNNIPLSASPEKNETSSTRVEYRHSPELTEWYHNGVVAMEHGYTVAQRPAHLNPTEEVVIEVALYGLTAAAHTAEDGSYQLNFNEGKRTVLSYSKLLVVDAQGQELPATMEPIETGFLLAYNDAQAVYPVTVDPLIVNEEAELSANDASSSDRFGTSVAISGDTVVVGAERDDDGGSASGSAYIFTRFGSSWSLQAKLTADDAAREDRFGFSVAISGDSVAVGAYRDDDGGLNSGSAYLFTRVGSLWSLQEKLTAGDAASEDNFGYSVAISGDSVIVGARLNDDNGSFSGSAYVFNRSGSSWAQQAKLTASDAAAGDNFGISVAISGDSAVVGANLDDNIGTDYGSAYVFNRSGSSWSQQDKLTAGDAAASDNFGDSVAISGDTIVVGAYSDDDAGSASGSAYVFTRSGSLWSQQAKLNAGDATALAFFGESVAISDDSIAVGANGDSHAGLSSGGVYIFTRSGSSWSQQDKLTASDAAANDNFGKTVAISGDSVVAGAHLDDDDGSSSGSAYVFTRSGTSWSQQDKLTANEAAELDRFGDSVAISGDSVVVGVKLDDDGGISSGSAYVFTRSGNLWFLQAKLRANDAAASDSFGESVAISGDSVVVGADGDDDGGSSSGSAYVFTRSGSSWAQQAKLTADDAASADFFGRSVSISGHSVVIGAFRSDNCGLGSSGSAYIFTRSGTSWSQESKLTADDAAAADFFGFSVAISGDSVVVGAFQDDDVRTNSGSAYVFTRSGSLWSQQDKLTSDDPVVNAWFGASVAISEDSIVVGVEQEEFIGSISTGSARVFTRSGSSWSQQAKLTASDPANDDGFGKSVSISGDSVVVGALNDDDGGTSSGSAYLYTRSGTSWSQEAKLTAGDAAAFDFYGHSVAISGDSVVVGAYGDNDEAPDAGSIYLYRFAISGQRELLVYDHFGTQLTNSSAAASFNGQQLGTSEAYTFRLVNGGELDLDLQSISRGGANLGEFSLTLPVISSTVDLTSSQSLDFTITFTPSGPSTALRNASVLITSNDSSDPIFTFNISGLGLSHSTDGDGDGMNDWAEYSLRGFGFDWETAQPNRVNDLLTNASTAGLYTESAVQAIHVGTPMLQVTGGTATLTIGIEKATDLSTFLPFPFTDPETTINSSGEIEFQFPVLDDAAFYLLNVE